MAQNTLRNSLHELKVRSGMLVRSEYPLALDVVVFGPSWPGDLQKTGHSERRVDQGGAGLGLTGRCRQRHGVGISGHRQEQQMGLPGATFQIFYEIPSLESRHAALIGVGCQPISDAA